MNELPLQIRYAGKDDVAFITNSWLKSYRESHSVDSIPNRVYYWYHHKILEQLLARSAVVVLCNEEDPDQILAWACVEKLVDKVLVIHYLYVKHAFRKQGLARRLMGFLFDKEKPSAMFVTHWTRAAAGIEYHFKRQLKVETFHLPSEQGPLPVVYNPYLLYHKLPEDWDAQPA